MGIFGSGSNGKRDSRNIDTLVGAQAVFDGTLTTKNSVCVEGTYRGVLRSEGSVILGRSGVIEGDVVAQHVSVQGRIEGNVTALKQLDVGETGRIVGDVQAASVTVSMGGVLEGTCRMIDKAPEKGQPAPGPARGDARPATPDPAAPPRTPPGRSYVHRDRKAPDAERDRKVAAAEA